MDFIGGNFVNFFAAIGAVSTAFLILHKIIAFGLISKVLPQSFWDRHKKKITSQLVICSCIVAVFVVLLESPVNFAAWFIGIAASFIGIQGLVCTVFNTIADVEDNFDGTV